jgi:23S rRNA (cytidine1920-2'-O)/16S rRNA (cytidine1409-2'-O)-methyltransferase
MPRSAARSRIDTLLVERGLVQSRAQAQAILLAGSISVDGATVTKPGALVSPGATIEVLRRPRYVSRGGDKLAHALATFAIDVTGLTCIDVGASTGGFTDCLLQNGARRVYAVDVGRGQLHERLRARPEVVSLEATDIRDLAAGQLAEPPDFVTVDVSFISLKLVLPAALALTRRPARLIALIKPQFEAERHEIGKSGVVRDAAVHERVRTAVAAWLEGRGWTILGVTPSPITGPEGNVEFLIAATRA